MTNIGARPDRPTLSVALATYNGARFLAEQLDSIASQALRPDELVASDDGSTDDTLRIVQSFANGAPFPVRVLERGPRLGFADNFLRATAACRGDVVALCDQDDVWLPSKLHIGLDRLVRDGSMLSMHRLTLTDEELRPTGVYDQGIVRDGVYEPLTLDPQAGWGNTMMFRRELASLVPADRRPRHPGFDRLLSHDTWLYMLAAALGRVSHIAEPLILYRQHGNNAAGVEPASRWQRLRQLAAEPVEGFRRKATLDGGLAPLLSELAERSTGERRERASAAATCLALRAERLRYRIAAYESGSALARLEAFLAALRCVRGDPAAARHAYKAVAKDLALGVTGLARRTSPPGA